VKIFALEVIYLFVFGLEKLGQTGKTGMESKVGINGRRTKTI
jgi:hypothetical protein